MNHQNHSNNAKKQKNFQMTKHLHRDLSTTNQKNRPFGLPLGMRPPPQMQHTLLALLWHNRVGRGCLTIKVRQSSFCAKNLKFQAIISLKKESAE